MANYWYQCKNCGTAIKQERIPSSSGCPNSTFHSWKKLAEVGDTNYSCKNCGTTIQANRNPLSSGCPSSTFHSWKKQ